MPTKNNPSIEFFKLQRKKQNIAFIKENIQRPSDDTMRLYNKIITNLLTICDLMLKLSHNYVLFVDSNKISEIIEDLNLDKIKTQQLQIIKNIRSTENNYDQFIKDIEITKLTVNSNVSLAQRHAQLAKNIEKVQIYIQQCKNLIEQYQQLNSDAHKQLELIYQYQQFSSEQIETLQELNMLKISTIKELDNNLCLTGYRQKLSQFYQAQCQMKKISEDSIFLSQIASSTP